MAQSRGKPRHGGRRPGAGRKPIGDAPKTGNFSTRISMSTRHALEEAAHRRRQTLSKVAEDMLELGLRVREDQLRDDPTRALCYLVAELAYNVGGSFLPGGVKPAYNWRTDPFMYESLRLAVGKLLAAMRPGGEMKSPLEGVDPALLFGLPPAVIDSYKTPEARADAVFMYIWQAFQTSVPMSGEELEGARNYGPRGSVIERQHNAMAQARRVLQSKP
jgi:hypothetical protein